MSEEKPLSIEKCDNCKRLIHRSNNGDCPYCKELAKMPTLRNVGIMSREQIKDNSSKASEIVNVERDMTPKEIWNAAILKLLLSI